MFSKNINCFSWGGGVLPTFSCLWVLMDPKSSDGPQHLGSALTGPWQVAYSVFRNWGRAVLTGGTQRWSRLLCWRKESPLDHKSTSLMLIYPEPIVTGLAILANPFLPIVLKTKVIMKVYR